MGADVKWMERGARRVVLLRELREHEEDKRSAADR
jgi:hypothetical protein